ncbi:MAG: glycosyltransferase family 39 protein [Pseudomonadota bacterium]
MRPEAQSWQSTAVDTAQRSLGTSTPGFSWLGKPQLIFGLIGVYLVGHLLLRLALSPTLGIDDAEQMLFARHWAFGYRFRQPPLFTWMLVPVIDLIGPSLLAISLVRYALLGITFAFLYLTARLCLKDQRLAGLAGLSFTLIYVFAYYAHHDLTHTTALSAMIALALYVTARLTGNPNWTAYLAAGLVFGLGMLAKWNFVMLAIGVPLTCLVLPAFRHFVLTWKILATVAVMAVVITPTALWMFDQGQSIQGVSSDILVGSGAGGHMALWLEGGAALLRATFLFPLPFLLIFLALFSQNLFASHHPKTGDDRPALTPVFFGCLILIMLGLHVLLIPLFGAVNFTERWLHPALMSLPIFLFACVDRNHIPDRRIGAFIVMVAILVAVAAGARLYRYNAGADDCSSCREFAPFAVLAEGLRSAGFSKGVIVADGMHIGGNLKMLFADSLVVDPAFPRAVWPEADDRSDIDTRRATHDCLLVWRDDGRNPEARRDLMRDYATKWLGLPETTRPRSGRLDAPLIGSSDRSYALGFEFYQENAGGCR